MITIYKHFFFMNLKINLRYFNFTYYSGTIWTNIYLFLIRNRCSMFFTSTYLTFRHQKITYMIKSMLYYGSMTLLSIQFS